jgi:hypothetical protein
VNAVFANDALFGEGFLLLEHGRDESYPPPALTAGEPRVEMLLVGRSGRAGADARGVEADAIARRLRELVDAGVPQGDIVLLMRALTHADTYAAALRRHDLDYTIVAGGSFFGRPEVEAVRAFLRAASNPLDDEALALTLASGMVGLSDDALARLRAAADRRPLWLAAGEVGLVADDEARLRVARAALEVARADAERRPVAEIIHRGCEQLDYDLYLLTLGSEGRRAYANVLKLARLSEEFERAGGTGLRAFLDHLVLKERYSDREAPASVVDERADAVRIMSVHAAKGLEFPVVAVPELGRDVQGDKGPLVLEKHDCGARLSLSLRDDDSSKAEERRSRWASGARDRARSRDVEEEKRLFYVACTRARESLVLSGTGDLSKPAGNNALGWLRQALAVDADGQVGSAVGASLVRSTYLDGSTAPAEPRPPRERAPGPEACSSPEEPLASAGVALERTAMPPEVSYSSMRLYGSCGLRYYAERIARIGDARSRDSHDPLRFGDAVHAALRPEPTRRGCATRSTASCARTPGARRSRPANRPTRCPSRCRSKAPLSSGRWISWPARLGARWSSTTRQAPMPCERARARPTGHKRTATRSPCSRRERLPSRSCSSASRPAGVGQPWRCPSPTRHWNGSACSSRRVRGRRHSERGRTSHSEPTSRQHATRARPRVGSVR